MLPLIPCFPGITACNLRGLVAMLRDKPLRLRSDHRLRRSRPCSHLIGPRLEVVHSRRVKWSFYLTARLASDSGETNLNEKTALQRRLPQVSIISIRLCDALLVGFCREEVKECRSCHFCALHFLLVSAGAVCMDVTRAEAQHVTLSRRGSFSH